MPAYAVTGQLRADRARRCRAGRSLARSHPARDELHGQGTGAAAMARIQPQQLLRRGRGDQRRGVVRQRRSGTVTAMIWTPSTRPWSRLTRSASRRCRTSCSRCWPPCPSERPAWSAAVRADRRPAPRPRGDRPAYGVTRVARLDQAATRRICTNAARLPRLARREERRRRQSHGHAAGAGHNAPVLRTGGKAARQEGQGGDVDRCKTLWKTAAPPRAQCLDASRPSVHNRRNPRVTSAR